MVDGRDTEEPDLPLLLQLLHRVLPFHFFDPLIPPDMELLQVEALGLKISEALLRVHDDPFSGEGLARRGARLGGPVGAFQWHLGGDEHAMAGLSEGPGARPPHPLPTPQAPKPPSDTSSPVRPSLR